MYTDYITSINIQQDDRKLHTEGNTKNEQSAKCGRIHMAALSQQQMNTQNKENNLIARIMQ